MDSAKNHHEMLRDYVRVMAYRSAIFANVKDRVVVEIGCGTGILSIFAAQAGARHVYAIETEKIANLAQLMFRANGFRDRITLLRGHSTEVELPEKADLLIHEILGSDPFEEAVLPTLADARKRLLKPGARMLPHRLEVALVGVEYRELPTPTERMLKEASEFAGLYGVNFDAYLIALDADRPSLNASKRRLLFGERDEKILTEPSTLLDLDLEKGSEDISDVELFTEMTANAQGNLGGILLYFRAYLDERLQVTTSPFAPSTCWGLSVQELPRAVAVQPGKKIRLRSRITTVRRDQRVVIEVVD